MLFSHSFLYGIIKLNPVLCGEWYFIKYDDHDTAKALILSEEISTAEVDKVKAHGKGHREPGEVSYLTGNVSKLRQIPNEKHWSVVLRAESAKVG